MNADALSRNPVMLIQADSIMRQAQLQDSTISYYLKDVLQPNSLFYLDQETEVLMKRVKKKQPDGQIKIKSVLVLPAKFRDEAMASCHDAPLSGAHLGEKKSMNKLADRFWWPRMRAEFMFWISSCPECMVRKPTSAPNMGKLQSIPVFEPFELIGIDITGPFPLSDNGNRYIVVFTDHFTKWAEASAVPNHDAMTIANLIVTNIILRFGAPKMLVSDRDQSLCLHLCEKCSSVWELTNVDRPHIILKLMDTQKG